MSRSGHISHQCRVVGVTLRTYQSHQCRVVGVTRRTHKSHQSGWWVSHSGHIGAGCCVSRSGQIGVGCCVSRSGHIGAGCCVSRSGHISAGCCVSRSGHIRRCRAVGVMHLLLLQEHPPPEERQRDPVDVPRGTRQAAHPHLPLPQPAVRHHVPQQEDPRQQVRLRGEPLFLILLMIVVMIDDVLQQQDPRQQVRLRGEPLFLILERVSTRVVVVVVVVVAQPDCLPTLVRVPHA